MISLIKHQLKRVFRPSLAIAYDNLALSMLRSFKFDYLPWTAAAIRPAALCAVLNEIVINQRRSIIEFGCGISTLYIAAALKQSKGKIISVEHDAQWRSIIHLQLARYDLLDIATVVHAPLAPCEHSLAGCLWYDGDLIGKAMTGSRFDGVVVDGPPASSEGRELARYPAIPIVKDYLSDNYFIYLDDITRRGERDIFSRWQSILNLNGRQELAAGQFGMIRKGGQFSVSLGRDK